MCFDKPVDDLRGGAGHRGDQRIVVFVVRLGLNIGGKTVGAVTDPRVLLQARPSRGDQPGAQRGRACGDRISLKQQHILSRLMRRQRRDHTAGTRADDQGFDL